MSLLQLFCDNFINFRIFLTVLDKDCLKNLKIENIEKNNTDITVENNYKDVLILKSFDKLVKYIPSNFFNQLDEEKEENNENLYIDNLRFLKFTNQNIKILNKKLEE